jgi:hypothetical protein
VVLARPARRPPRRCRRKHLCRAPFGPTRLELGGAGESDTDWGVRFPGAGVIFTVAVLGNRGGCRIEDDVEGAGVAPRRNPKFGLARQLIPAVGAARAKSLKFGLADRADCGCRREGMAAPLRLVTAVWSGWSAHHPFFIAARGVTSMPIVLPVMMNVVMVPHRRAWLR